MASTFERYDQMSTAGDFGQHDPTLAPQQRWLSMAAGAGLAAYGLSRLSLRALAALAAGGYLIYRGGSGRCPMCERLSESGLLAGGAQWFSRGAQEQSAPYASAEYSDLDSFIEREPIEARSLREVDAVDEAAMESFPASDAPSYTGAAATPSKPIE